MNIYVDVGNTLAVPFMSGIQRVVRELTPRLAQTRGTGTIIPVRYCSVCNHWLAANLEQLNVPPLARSRLVKTASMLARAIPPPLKSTLARLLKLATHPGQHRALQIDHFEPGSVFFDIDASWHIQPDRRSLLPALTKAGIKTVVMHYDIIPIQHPQWAHQDTLTGFENHLQAHLSNHSTFLCISESSQKLLQEYSTRPVKSHVVRLGEDFRSTSPQSSRSRYNGKKYLLCVGTLEPRKNHALLLDAFDAVAADHPELELILVGRLGWHSKELQHRIKRHPKFGNQIFWHSQTSDAELATLYENAYLSVVPSLAEGFGLPVIESLNRGIVTLSSNAGALPEAGGNYVDYFDPRNPDQLAQLIRGYLQDAEKHLQQQRRIDLRKCYGWEQSADEVMRLLIAQQ